MITRHLKRLIYTKQLIPIVVETELGMLNSVLGEVREKGLDKLSTKMEGIFTVLPTLPTPIAQLGAMVQPPAPFKPLTMPKFSMFNLMSHALEIDVIDGISGVKNVYYDQPMVAFQPSLPIPPWVDMKGWVAISAVVRKLKVDKLWEQGYKGKGVKVSVIDTGAQTIHPMLKLRVRTWAVPPHPDIDENGHGMWCTCVICGGKWTSPLGIECQGFAPDVDMYSIKALGFGVGSGSTSGILSAMEKAVEWGADVVSMSLGSEGVPEKESPLCKIINDYKDKVLWVIAAGNSGPDKATIGTPGNASGAITVGSISYMDYPEPAHFSSRGPTVDGYTKPDICAFGGGRKSRDIKPDEYVCMGTSTGSMLDIMIDRVVDGLAPLHGTSMSCPEVAAILALWKQICKAEGLELTTNNVKTVFKKYGKAKMNDVGHGLIDAEWIWK